MRDGTIVLVLWSVFRRKRACGRRNLREGRFSRRIFRGHIIARRRAARDVIQSHLTRISLVVWASVAVMELLDVVFGRTARSWFGASPKGFVPVTEKISFVEEKYSLCSLFVSSWFPCPPLHLVTSDIHFVCLRQRTNAGDEKPFADWNSIILA